MGKFLYLLSCLVLFVVRGEEEKEQTWWSSKLKSREKIADTGHNTLHAVENTVGKVMEWTGTHRRAVRAAANAAMLFHGGRFSHSMLLFQTVRVTAGPSLGRAARDLKTNYSNVRSEVKRQVPSIDIAKRLLKEYRKENEILQQEIRKAKELAKKGSLTKDELKRALNTVQQRSAEIQKHSEELNSVLSSIAAVASAIEIEKVKDLMRGCFTAVTR